MAEYADAGYWNERYKRDQEPFEWYQEYSGIKDILRPYITDKSTVLVIGCGNSTLSEHIYKQNGAHFVESIDISYVVIDALKQKYIQFGTGMKFTTMDIRKLEYPAERFDVIIDKGCLDSMLCGNDSEKQAEQAIGECARVLKPGGTMILISHATPENREPMFKNALDNWAAVTCTTLQKPKLDDGVDTAQGPEEVHYCYVIHKNKKRI